MKPQIREQHYFTDGWVMLRYGDARCTVRVRHQWGFLIHRWARRTKVWARLNASRALATLLQSQEAPANRFPIFNQDFYSDGSGRLPRYYQTIAINRAIEAVAGGQK